MDWFVFWIILYSIIIIVLTIKHIKLRSLEKYLINDRRTRTIPLVFSTLATFVGGGVSVGLIAIGYEAGFVGVAIGIAFVIGFFIIARFASRINALGKKFSIYSFSEFLNRNYTNENDPFFSKLFSSIVSTINIFIFFFLLSAQFVGMASLIEGELGIGYLYAAILSCIIVIGYTAYAGLSGVILTDMLQFVIIIIMIVVIFIPGINADTNGLSYLDKLPSDMLNGTTYGLIFLIGLPLFLSPSVIVRMDIWQRLLSASSGKTAKRASIISGLGMLPFYIVFPLVGMAVRLGHDKMMDPKFAAHTFLAEHCNDFLLGFAIVGLISALMSSGDSFLNIISISAVKDYVGWKKPKKKSDKNGLYVKIKIATLIFGFLALLLSIVLPKIVDLMVVGTSAIVVFVPCTFLALIKKNVFLYRKVAISSIVTGFIINIIFFVFGIISPENFESKSSFVPAFIISFLTLVIGLAITRRKTLNLKY